MSDTIQTFELMQQNPKRRWVLFLHPDRLILTCDEKSLTYEVARQDAPEKIELVGGGNTGLPMLIVRATKSVGLKVTAEALPSLREWIGPLTEQHLKAALKRRLNLTLLPLGGLFLLTSLPLRSISGQGIPSYSFDPLAFILGAVLISMAIASKLKPHRVLFLLDSIWMCALAGRVSYGVLANGKSWVWAIAVVFQLLIAINGYVQYRRFAPDKMQAGIEARRGQDEAPAYAKL